MSVIRFTGFKVKNNAGTEIKCDQDGYYEIIVGGLNILNSSGQLYSYDGAKELFEGSSTLRRRIENGALKGEVGHPVKESGMSSDKFLERWIEIRDRNVCVHFSDIWLDTDRIKDEQGRGVVAVVAKLKPSGVHGAMLKDALDNSKENVAFSVRGFTEDKKINGITLRVLKTIITYDYVNEPGISIANKFKTANAGLGNLSGESVSFETEQTFDRIVTDEDLKLVEKKIHDQETGLSAENFLGSIQEDLKQILPKHSLPIFTKW